MRTSLVALPMAMLFAAAVPPAHAQQPALPQPVDSATTSLSGRGWSALRVAKWTTAAAAVGTAAYGFINNQRADDRYEQLEQLCVNEPLRCANLLPNGAYADPALEADYQEVRAIDRRARTALIAGQVGMAASVVLFLLDLRNSEGPENIPYEPRTIDILPARDGGLSLRMNLHF